MPAESQEKELVRRAFEQVLNRKDPSLLAEYYSSNYRAETPDGPFVGLAGVRSLLDRYATAFPDFQIVIDDLIGEGDEVAAHYTFTGTNTGPVLGAPPTGNSVQVKGTVISRVKAGKIVEERFVWDSLALAQQLGFLAQSAAR